MKLNKLMLGLAFVACAGLVMTSCKKKNKGEGLSKDEAQIELIAIQEALEALDNDVSEMPAVKILDYMMVSHGGLKVAQFDHLAMDYWHKAYFYWKDKASDFQWTYGTEKGIYGIYGMEDGKLDINRGWADFYYGVAFPYNNGTTSDSAFISWENVCDSAGVLGGSLNVRYPHTFTTNQGTPTLSTVYCGVLGTDRNNGNINFTLTGNDKHLTFASNNGATTGLGRGNMVVGSGSYVHTFFIQNSIKDNLYKVVKGHVQAGMGLVGYDKDEFVVGSLQMEMTTKTILTSSTDIVLYRMGETKDKICSMAADGTITYKDGSTSALSSVAPKLWEHLKSVFPEKLK